MTRPALGGAPPKLPARAPACTRSASSVDGDPVKRAETFAPTPAVYAAAAGPALDAERAASRGAHRGGGDRRRRAGGRAAAGGTSRRIESHAGPAVNVGSSSQSTIDNKQQTGI